MENLAGYVSGDLGAPEWMEAREHRFTQAYEAAMNQHEGQAVLEAERFLSGENTETFRDTCWGAALGCEDCAVRIYALLLVGGASPARNALVEALCQRRATNDAEEA